MALALRVFNCICCLEERFVVRKSFKMLSCGLDLGKQHMDDTKCDRIWVPNIGYDDMVDNLQGAQCGSIESIRYLWQCGLVHAQ